MAHHAPTKILDPNFIKNRSASPVVSILMEVVEEVESASLKEAASVELSVGSSEIPQGPERPE